jgi:hypothetical protein
MQPSVLEDDLFPWINRLYAGSINKPFLRFLSLCGSERTLCILMLVHSFYRSPLPYTYSTPAVPIKEPFEEPFLVPGRTLLVSMYNPFYTGFYMEPIKGFYQEPKQSWTVLSATAWQVVPMHQVWNQKDPEHLLPPSHKAAKELTK